MPATSEKQKKFMDAVAHNPAFAKASGVPVKVAKEFSEKSKGMKFGKDTNTSRADLQKVNKPKTLHGKMSLMKKGGNTMAASKRVKRFDDGGVVANSNYPFGQGQVSSAPAPVSTGLGNNSPLVQVTTGAADTAQVAEMPATTDPVQMKKGGKVTARRGDGIAQRGRTKGRFV